MKRPSIEQFENSTSFLKSYFDYLRALEPDLTVRRWSVRMGLSSPTPLVAILGNKRKPRLKDLDFILKGMDLSLHEGRYLSALVLWESASASEEKKILRIALDSIRTQLPESEITSKQESVFEAQDDDLFSHWLDAALVSALRLRSAGGDVDRIQSSLLWEENSLEVEKSLERIRRHGLLQDTPKQGLKPAYDSVTTRSDRYHRGARAYFAQMNEIATKAVELPFEKREFQCFSIPVRQSDIPAFKALLRGFREEIADFSAEDGDTVYQFNLEMFPLTEPICGDESEKPYSASSSSEI